jgi:hypothetical protein
MGPRKKQMLQQRKGKEADSAPNKYSAQGADEELRWRCNWQMQLWKIVH